MPYVQYGGGSLALVLEPRCSKLEGSLQAFQEVDYSLELSLPREGFSLLYFKVGPPIYIFLS